MRILGIDPGSRSTGFGVIEIVRADKIIYLASGCVRVTATDLAERLCTIYNGISEVIANHAPVSVAIEKVFMARNADSALKLGQARGAAVCAVGNHDLPLNEYTALQIKRAVVGAGHARKEQVQHMVCALLGLNAAPQADAADALACALYHAYHSLGTQAVARGRGIAQERVLP